MATNNILLTGNCGDNVTYTLYDDYELVISGSGDMYDYKSNEAEGTPWYSYRYSITSVIIEDGVTRIGNFAFGFCSRLKSAYLGSTLNTIADHVFYFCSGLTSIEIPESVSSLGQNVFAYCSSLSEITIPENVTKIGGYAFLGCKLTSVVIPEGVTSINSLFQSCTSLTNVTLPQSLTEIGYSSFYNCTSLSEITIPENVTKIGGSAFYKCNLTSVVIPKNVTSLGSDIFDGNSNLTTITCEATTPPSLSTTLVDDPSIVQLLVPPGCLSLYQQHAYWGLFTNISEYKTILLTGKCGDNVTYTLYDDYELVISGSGDMYDYENIKADGAFVYGTTAPWDNYTNRITSVIIEDGVTRIGNFAFGFCSSRLTSAYLGSTLNTIGDHAFYYCTYLTSIEIPESVSSLGISAFKECGQLSSVNFLGNNMHTIQDECFSSCSNLESINLPESLSSIGSSAFYSCENLKEITIPENVTTIGGYAFYCCYSLNNVVIPEGVTSIYSLFQSCTSLTNVTLPQSLTDIGAYSFKGCTSLSEITIPENVTRIGDFAFSNNSNLTTITCEATTPPSQPWPPIVDDPSSIQLFVPPGCLSLYQQDADWAVFTNMSEYSTNILEGQCGDNMYFYISENYDLHITGSGDMWNFSSLEERPWHSYIGQINNIYFPEDGSISMSIGNFAFHGCIFTTVEFTTNITTIGTEAFYGCYNLSSIHFHYNIDEIKEYAFAESGINSIYCYNKNSETLQPIIHDKAFFDYTNKGFQHLYIYNCELNIYLKKWYDSLYRYCGWNTNMANVFTTDYTWSHVYYGNKRLDVINTFNTGEDNMINYHNPFAYILNVYQSLLGDGLWRFDYYTATASYFKDDLDGNSKDIQVVEFFNTSSSAIFTSPKALYNCNVTVDLQGYCRIGLCDSDVFGDRLGQPYVITIYNSDNTQYNQIENYLPKIESENCSEYGLSNTLTAWNGNIIPNDMDSAAQALAYGDYSAPITFYIPEGGYFEINLNSTNFINASWTYFKLNDIITKVEQI